MCHKGKCMFCLDVETGTLIFAIFKIVITSIGTLASVGGLVYFNVILEDSVNDAKPSFGDTWAHVNSGTNEVLSLLCASYFIAFVFAVILIFGICKRKAGLVKSYFVYGIVKMVLAVAGIIGSLIYAIQLITSPLLLIYAIYAPILYMIHMTYKKFEKENGFTAFSNPISVIEKF